MQIISFKSFLLFYVQQSIFCRRKILNNILWCWWRCQFDQFHKLKRYMKMDAIVFDNQVTATMRRPNYGYRFTFVQLFQRWIRC